MSYLGACAHGVPGSYTPIENFATATGVEPNIALYYSGWGEPFQATFAKLTVRHHAVPLIQIEPGTTRLREIADGGYDAYLGSYATAVASFGRQTGHGVIIGFAREPNGSWYPPGGYRGIAPCGHDHRRGALTSGLSPRHPLPRWSWRNPLAPR